MGGSDDYRHMLEMLLDYYICGSHEVRYETFKRMLEDNSRRDLHKLIPEGKSLNDYNDVLELFRVGLNEADTKAMFCAIV